MAGNLESRIVPLSDLSFFSSPYRSERDDPSSDIIKPEEPWHEIEFKGHEVTGASLLSLSDQTNALILKFNGAKKGMQVLLNGPYQSEQGITDHFVGSEFLGKSINVPHIDGLFPTKGLIFAKPDGSMFCLECCGSVPCPAQRETASQPPPAGGFSFGKPPRR